MPDLHLHERRSHFRGKPRPGRRVEVCFRVLQHGELSQPHWAHTKNVGVGGAFIVTPDPPPVGSRLQVQLVVPVQSPPVEVAAEVRWIVDHLDDAREHGMGVKFSSLEFDQLLALNEFFASLTSSVDHDG